MALSLAALRDWRGEARVPFRLQAVLIGLICFSAAACRDSYRFSLASSR
jgi:hypothetical protein